MTKLLRSTALSALALLFVACDPAIEDEATQALAAELQDEDAADGLVVPYHLVADDGDDDGPADPTPFFDLERLATDDPGCATGGEDDALDLAAAAQGEDEDEDEDLGFAVDHGQSPDPEGDAPALDLVAADAEPSAVHEDDEDLSLTADLDATEEDTSGFEDEPEFVGA